MNCEQVITRLPDEDPEVAEHLEQCASCRALQEAYRRDAVELAAGLRELAGDPVLDPAKVRRPASPPRRQRSFIPLAAAAALVLGILGVILFSPETPAPTAQAPAENPHRFMVPDPDSLPVQLLIVQSGSGLQMLAARKPVWGAVLSIDVPAGRISASIGRTDVTAPDQEFVIYRQTERGYVKIGAVVFDALEDSLSHGPVESPALNPRVGDFVVPAEFLNHAEKEALLAYVFSFRPVTGKDRSRILSLLNTLGSDTEAGRKLAAMGGVAAVVLDGLVTEGHDTFLLANGARALSEGAPVGRLVRGSELERNVEFLARLDDPRAYPRLKRILAAVQPLSREGVPPAGPKLAERLHAWWAEAKHRVRWSPEADRYEDR